MDTDESTIPYTTSNGMNVFEKRVCASYRGATTTFLSFGAFLVDYVMWKPAYILAS